jgi:hypothetical protein
VYCIVNRVCEGGREGGREREREREVVRQMMAFTSLTFKASYRRRHRQQRQRDKSFALFCMPCHLLLQRNDVTTTVSMYESVPGRVSISRSSINAHVTVRTRAVSLHPSPLQATHPNHNPRTCMMVVA